MPCDFPLDKLNQALAFWPPNIVLVQHRYRTSSPTLLFKCPGIFCKSPFLILFAQFFIITYHRQVKFNSATLFPSDITGMASSSVSQEDFDNDFELTSRRSRIRTARARVVPPRAGDSSSINFQSNDICSLFCYFVLYDALYSIAFVRRGCTECRRISRCV